MNTSITQATQNDKQVSKSIKRFFTRFHLSSALKAANAYKRKGIPVTEIFQYLFLCLLNGMVYTNHRENNLLIIYCCHIFRTLR